MNPQKVEADGLAEALRAIREELARLGERVAALEASSARGQGSGVRGQELTPDPRPLSSEKEGLSEELVLVISAAIAAFLGKKPHIRQIRLLGAAAWAQQGRVMIQASHALSARQTR